MTLWTLSRALAALLLSVWISLGTAKKTACSVPKYEAQVGTHIAKPPTCRFDEPDVSISRVYADVNTNSPAAYSDFESVEFQWGPSTKYLLDEDIGQGQFSVVFLGHSVESGERVVIKILEPVKMSQVNGEIKCLQTLRDGPNMIQLLDLVKNEESMEMWLVFEYVNNTDFTTLNENISDYDIRYYLYQIFKSLDYAHSMGIMHRDIKPHNIMIDHPNRKLRLIDWGIAEHYYPEKAYKVRVASLYYKGPELLAKLPTYDYSLDIWGVGVMFATMLFKKMPFFDGKDRDDMLVKIAEVLGSADLLEYLKKYRLTLEPSYLELLMGHEKKEWSEFIDESNEHIAHPEAIELLSGLLRYDQQTRLTAKEAMAMPYFAPIREAEAKAANVTSQSCSSCVR